MLELAGRTLSFIGRLAAVPRRVAAVEAARRGAIVRRGLARRTDYAVVGRGARELLAGGRLFAALEEADQAGAVCLSERAFLRAVELLPPDPAEPGALPLGQLAASAKLEPEVVRILELFDLIEVRDGRCGFRDLVTAREVARLLRENVSLGAILDGVGRLGGEVSHPLASRKLVCDEDGRLVVRCHGGFAELDGQMRLPLPGTGNPTADALFEAAEEAEEQGDWPAATGLYLRCLELDRRDPIIPFNLANVLYEQDRVQEAKWYLQLAAGIDPNFAEAWYNLAGLLENEGRRDVAREYLLRAVAADPEYSDPVYNLAHWHFEAGEFADAARWWQQYLALDPDSEWGRKARRGLLLCQQQLQQAE